MKKYLSILLLTILIIPSITFASWWNPISWFKAKQPSQNLIEVSSSTQAIPIMREFSLWKPSSWFKTKKSEEVKEATTIKTKEIENTINGIEEVNNEEAKSIQQKPAELKDQQKTEAPLSSAIISAKPTSISKNKTPPAISSDSSATIPVQYSAVLNGDLLPSEYITTSIWFEYGTSPWQLNMSSPHNEFKPDNNFVSGKAISSVISNLTANTTYYFRVAVKGSYGIMYGNATSFITTGPMPINAGTSTVSVQSVGGQTENITPTPIISRDMTGICTKEEADKGDYKNFILWPDSIFNNHLEPDKFNVEVEGKNVTISIPGRMLNADRYDVEYIIYTWFKNEGKQDTSTEYDSMNTVPFSFELPEGYLGHKVYFQLFVKYECARYVSGIDSWVGGRVVTKDL